MFDWVLNKPRSIATFFEKAPQNLVFIKILLAENPELGP